MLRVNCVGNVLLQLILVGRRRRFYRAEKKNRRITKTTVLRSRFLWWDKGVFSRLKTPALSTWEGSCSFSHLHPARSWSRRCETARGKIQLSAWLAFWIGEKLHFKCSKIVNREISKDWTLTNSWSLAGPICMEAGQCGVCLCNHSGSGSGSHLGRAIPRVQEWFFKLAVHFSLSFLIWALKRRVALRSSWKQSSKRSFCSPSWPALCSTDEQCTC